MRSVLFVGPTGLWAYQSLRTLIAERTTLNVFEIASRGLRNLHKCIECVGVNFPVTVMRKLLMKAGNAAKLFLIRISVVEI